MLNRKTLLFISPRFLLPVDSGGKIRTTQTLRGLKGGQFKIRLVSPATAELVAQYSRELAELCDEFIWWPATDTSAKSRLRQVRHIFSSLPIPIADDYRRSAADLVANAMSASDVCVVVFDFLHSVVLAPEAIRCPSVLFTHNVEAEIVSRHRGVATNLAMRALWSSQYKKMRAFEQRALRRFDTVVAVSDRDAAQFRRDYGIAEPFTIPTGVDLDYFAFSEPHREFDIVFCGSMDWLANREGVTFFLDEIWPLIVREVPEARMTVVGRSPPSSLVETARRRHYAWTFTGFVDDVRPHIRGAAVAVIPLRIGGGTRLKVFESMAAGQVVVSTKIGVEGLPVVSGEHCLLADEPEEFARAVVTTIRDRAQRYRMAGAAREYVQAKFGYLTAAKEFERACVLAIAKKTS